MFTENLTINAFIQGMIEINQEPEPFRPHWWQRFQRVLFAKNL